MTTQPWATERLRSLVTHLRRNPGASASRVSHAGSHFPTSFDGVLGAARRIGLIRWLRWGDDVQRAYLNHKMADRLFPLRAGPNGHFVAGGPDADALGAAIERGEA
jgi:hypothetical protein